MGKSLKNWLTLGKEPYKLLHDKLHDIDIDGE